MYLMAWTVEDWDEQSRHDIWLPCGKTKVNKYDMFYEDRCKAKREQHINIVNKGNTSTFTIYTAGLALESYFIVVNNLLLKYHV